MALATNQWRWSVRLRYLQILFHHVPGVLEELRACDDNTVGSWCERYHVGGTWLEDWARSALIFWRNHPAEAIYREKYQYDMERENLGKYLAIHVESQRAIIGETANEASQSARAQSPTGVFHLIRIGVGVEDWPTPDVGGGDKPFHFEVRELLGNLMDWESFKRRMHQKLDESLEAFREEGGAPQVKLPPDLGLALEYAAVNRFRDLGVPKIADLAGAKHGASRIIRLISQVNDILALPRLPLGTRGRKKTAHTTRPASKPETAYEKVSRKVRNHEEITEQDARDLHSELDPTGPLPDSPIRVPKPPKSQRDRQ